MAHPTERHAFTELTDQQLESIRSAWVAHCDTGEFKEARARLEAPYGGAEGLFRAHRNEIDVIVENAAARRTPGGAARAIVAAASWYHLAEARSHDLATQDLIVLSTPWHAAWD